MKNFDLFKVIFRQTKMKSFLISFAIAYFVCCFLIWMFDPDIQTYGDALWFGFMIVTTIGFGDITVSTLPARIVTYILGLYGVLAIGFICGAGASWLYEVVKNGKNESVSAMIWKLEHLDSLDEEQIQKLQKQAVQALHSDSKESEPEKSTV